MNDECLENSVTFIFLMLFDSDDIHDMMILEF